MKNLIVLFFAFIMLTACNISCFSQGNYKHKSENEIASMTPAQKVDEFFKEQHYHNGDPVDKYTAGRDQCDVIRDYILKDGVKALSALADIANRYDPDRHENYEQAFKFADAFQLTADIDNVVIRIRATEEGRSAINVFEDVLNRMKNAGYADQKHKWNNQYLAYLDWLKTLQGKRISFADIHIRVTLREKYKIQISDEEMIKFSNYLTSLDPTYPSWCFKLILGSPDMCRDSKEYYEAYLKFKSEVTFIFLLDAPNISEFNEVDKFYPQINTDELR